MAWTQPCQFCSEKYKRPCFSFTLSHGKVPHMADFHSATFHCLGSVGKEAVHFILQALYDILQYSNIQFENLYYGQVLLGTQLSILTMYAVSVKKTYLGMKSFPMCSPRNACVTISTSSAFIFFSPLRTLKLKNRKLPMSITRLLMIQKVRFTKRVRNVKKKKRLVA